MERCPQCRARYKDGDTCRRCGADLTLLHVIEAEADNLARQAVAQLLADDLPAAAEKASSSLKLHSTPFSRALAGFIESLTIEQ